MTTGVQPMSTLWQPTATHYRAHTWCARLLYQGQVLLLQYLGACKVDLLVHAHDTFHVPVHEAGTNDQAI